MATPSNTSDDTVDLIPAVTSPCLHLNTSSVCNFLRLFVVIFPPILLVFGTVGNVMSICVLTRKRMRMSSASVYLACLALADLIVLYVALLREWLVYVTGTDIRKVNDDTCRVLLWLQFGGFTTSIWILTALTVDRLVSVRNPIFAKVHCTHKVASLVVLVLTIIAFLLGMQYFGVQRVEHKVDFKSDNTSSDQIGVVRCEPQEVTYTFYYDKVMPAMTLSLCSLIPFITILVSNVWMVVILLKRKRSLRRVNPSGIAASFVPSLDADSRSLTKMFLATSAFFIVATLPTAIYLVMEPYLFRGGTMEDFLNRALFWACASFCFYSNSSFNFVIYCVSGSLFRRTLADMAWIKALRKCITGSDVQRLTSTRVNTNINDTSTLARSVNISTSAHQRST